MRNTQKKTESRRAAKTPRKRPALKDLEAKDPSKVKGGLTRLRNR